MLKNPSFFESKPFGVLTIVYGVLGFLLLGHHIFSYEAILRPYMPYLIENKIITNDISGGTFLYFFTNQSNIFVFIYLILFGIGLLGNKRLFALTHNDRLRGGVTLYILFTGLIYCGVLLPFATAGYPMEKGIWFSNVFNVFVHMLTPALITLLWFFPTEGRRIPVCKTAALYLLYPVSYFIFSVVRGGITGFYPYPFLNGQQLWNILFADQAYRPGVGVWLIAAVVVLFSALFFGIGAALAGIHNKRVKQKEPACSPVG